MAMRDDAYQYDTDHPSAHPHDIHAWALEKYGTQEAADQFVTMVSEVHAKRAQFSANVDRWKG